MRKILIAPSLLAANKMNLAQEVTLAVEAGADWLHFDVMDAKFVPNTALNVSELAEIRKITSCFLDVHLMIEKPLFHITPYIEAGADLITFHFEAMHGSDEIHQIIAKLRQANMKIGISIKPATPVECVFDYICDLDLVLVMGVEPGLGGQKFIHSSLEKIVKLRQIIDQNHYPCLIELDGGINYDTAKLCREAGVDVIVAGSYLFGREDFKKRMESLK